MALTNLALAIGFLVLLFRKPQPPAQSVMAVYLVTFLLSFAYASQRGGLDAILAVILGPFFLVLHLGMAGLKAPFLMALILGAAGLSAIGTTRLLKSRNAGAVSVLGTLVFFLSATVTAEISVFTKIELARRALVQTETTHCFHRQSATEMFAHIWQEFQSPHASVTTGSGERYHYSFQSARFEPVPGTYATFRNSRSLGYCPKQNLRAGR